MRERGGGAYKGGGAPGGLGKGQGAPGRSRTPGGVRRRGSSRSGGGVRAREREAGRWAGPGWLGRLGLGPGGARVYFFF